METVIIVVHLMIVLALVGVVLMQRSEGGGLGIGGGSGFMTARGAANALTRTTAILAAAFFVTSLTLGIMARYGEQAIDILDRAPTAPASGNQVPGGGILDQLGGSGAPQAPAPATSDAPPAPAGQAVPIAPLEPVAPAVPAPAPSTAPAPDASAPANGATQAPADNGAPTAPQAPAVPSSQ